MTVDAVEVAVRLGRDRQVIVTLDAVVRLRGARETEQEQEQALKHAEDIEETTEHSVLMDDANETNEVEMAAPKTDYHPDVLDADKLNRYAAQPVGDLDKQSSESFDEEATVITDPQQTVTTFNKPQMAESVKVKGKKKSGLFGWLKRKKK